MRQRDTEVSVAENYIRLDLIVQVLQNTLGLVEHQLCFLTSLIYGLLYIFSVLEDMIV